PNPVQVGENITFNFMIGGLEGTLRSVSLNIYDIKGKLVKEIINENMMVNDYTETWRVNDLANGVYFYQLKTENYQETKKLLIQ
ncbi:MAG: T9SS type A sorting domain-containing protein, partial [Candidatus Cloacimonetes bacterium]|nr:T9SS type A sorting domain-containing protein [Candidatus Cloacimonadota bacterium]